MKRIIALLILLLFPAAGMAEETRLEQPRWSLEVKGGMFSPSLPDWSNYYGKKDMPEFAVSLAYQFIPQLELGAGIGWIRGTGQYFSQLNGGLIGDVRYELFPAEVFVLARGVFSEEQWLIPYIGGGLTRMYYRQKVSDVGTFRGSTNGSHIRGGVELSLDALDQGAAISMFRDYGVYHSYLFIEAERTKAVLSSVALDLGGTAWLVGLRFEF